MDRLFRFSSARRHDPAIDTWLRQQSADLAPLVTFWFNQLRRCGEDVHELMHDGFPVACVNDAAFAYVNAFKAHANIGFFCGTDLDDPAQLLEGTGRRMRHVKLRPGTEVDQPALLQLVEDAYADMHRKLSASEKKGKP